jgi:hypothetical protein
MQVHEANVCYIFMASHIFALVVFARNKYRLGSCKPVTLVWSIPYRYDNVLSFTVVQYVHIFSLLCWEQPLFSNVKEWERKKRKIMEKVWK